MTDWNITSGKYHQPIWELDLGVSEAFSWTSSIPKDELVAAGWTLNLRTPGEQLCPPCSQTASKERA